MQLKGIVFLESKLSKNMMWLNQLRIDSNETARKKNLTLILNYFRRVCKYIGMGQLGYARYAVKRAFSVATRNERNTELSERSREIEKSERIAVYTVLFGKYDDLKEPLYVSSQCDYYILTNQKIDNYSVWKNYPIDKFSERTKGFSNLELARFFKTHPHLLFPDYKYSMFIDANIQIVTDMVPVIQQLGNNFIAIHNQPGRDCVYQEATEIIVIKKAPKDQIKPQVKAYKAEGFPEHYGLFRTCVVVREHNNETCKKVMDMWWNEMVKYSKRDQLSFTYCLWKLGLKKDSISSLGDDVRTNPRFIESMHK